MRSARFNLEDQVGGLIDHGDRRARRRAVAEAPASEPVESERYDLTPRPALAIRAARASSANADRRVA